VERKTDGIMGWVGRVGVSDYKIISQIVSYEIPRYIGITVFHVTIYRQIFVIPCISKDHLLTSDVGSL